MEEIHAFVASLKIDFPPCVFLSGSKVTNYYLKIIKFLHAYVLGEHTSMKNEL